MTDHDAMEALIGKDAMKQVDDLIDELDGNETTEERSHEQVISLSA